MKKLIITLLFMVLGFGLFVAGDTYDYKTNIDEGRTYVRYLGQIDMSNDTTGNHYTQALFIGDANQATGMLQAVCSNVPGTENVNVFLQLSNDRLNWIEIPTAIRTGLSTTVIYDTLNIINGVNRVEYKNSVWMRLKFDGQTGNPSTTITWSAYLPKNPGAPPTGVAAVNNRRS